MSADRAHRSLPTANDDFRPWFRSGEIPPLGQALSAPRDSLTHMTDLKAITAADLPPGAHALAQIGDRCAGIVIEYWSRAKGVPLLRAIDDEKLRRIAAAMAGTWRDDQGAEVLRAYCEQLEVRGDIDVSLLIKWIKAQPNDATAVKHCLVTKPPREVTLERVLSKAGNQKIVFLAAWNTLKTQVVVKKVVGDKPRVEVLTKRETQQTHPLVSDHPHIINTSLLWNEDGDPFLVEEKVESLDDRTFYQLEDAANLFNDIASALQFLHNERGWVHGDIKPDNIGRKGSRFLLLDFGIARDKREFTKEVTATGSIRTRAPELLTSDAYKAEPTKADVWALAATVFNVMAHRFPLFRLDEDVPKPNDVKLRERFAAELRERATRQWDTFVTSQLALFPDPIREPLTIALNVDPDARCTIDRLVDAIRMSLGSYLRDDTAPHHLSPSEELSQIASLVTPTTIAGAPNTFRSALRLRLENLKGKGGIDAARIDKLLGMLEPASARA